MNNEYRSVVDRGLHHQRKMTRESVAKENEIKVSNEEAKKGVMQMVAYLKNIKGWTSVLKYKND